MNKAISLYESTEQNIIKLNVDKNKFFRYRANTSRDGMEDMTAKPAFGEYLVRDCIDISDGKEVFGEVELQNADRRFYLKVIACLPDWKKYVCPLYVEINGIEVYNNNEAFFEQVCLGWPALYIALPEDVLKNGKNIVSVKSGGDLYLSELSLVSYPKIEDRTQVSIRNYARKGDKFAIAVNDKYRKFKKVNEMVNCTYLGFMYYKNLLVLSFNAGIVGDMACTIGFNDDTALSLDMPKVVDNDDYFIIGTDSDDHRQDDSDETAFIIETVVLSGLGNYIQFRPKFGRTYYRLLSEENFKNYIEFMALFGVKYGMSDAYKEELQFIPDIKPETFFGCHIHEPYLFMNSVLSVLHPMKSFFTEQTKKMESSQSFGESKDTFKEMLSIAKDLFSKKIGLTSFGCPSMLSVHEAEAGVDRITIEPASNIHLLVGAARTAAVKMWGAHIPADWYFGTPVDIVKANKYRLAMQYLYLNGASYVYAENSLFKTNGFARYDWESEYCKTLRKYQRDFYNYSFTHPRKGKLIVDKAIVYGRNECIMWKTNDRAAELHEGKDWDSNVWYKWDNAYHVAWNAADTWLPASDKQYSYEDIANKKLFSGTPFGNIDIVSAEKEFSKYSQIVFLGWNTMDDELIKKLKDYVSDGGTLMISYAHFNYTDRNDLEMTFPENNKIKDLIGLDIKKSTSAGNLLSFADAEFKLENNIDIVVGDSCGAKVICFDENGNGVVYKNKYGKGTIYFLAFKDYIKNENDVSILSYLMNVLGNKGDTFCDNTNISFTVRESADKYYISVLNMQCFEGIEEEFNIMFKGHNISGKIKVGEILDFVLDK